MAMAICPIIVHFNTRHARSMHDVACEFARAAVRSKDVRANCFCASLLRTAARANSHATSCIERARQVLKWTMIGQMAIAIALLGFNAIGCSVTDFIYNYLHIVKKWTKNQCGQFKKKSRFPSTGHGILPSCGCKVRETMVSKCELILWGTSPVY